MIRCSSGVARFAVLLAITLCAVGCGDFFPSTNAITGISISPQNGAVNPGGTALQFAAQGTMGNGQQKDVTNLVTWSSSNTSMATIDPGTGLATAVATGTDPVLGTTTISAKSSSASANASLIVTNVQTINITPPSATVSLSNPTVTFSATGTLVNGTQNVPLTNVVQWSTDNPDATITSAGVFTFNGTNLSSTTVTVTAAIGSITKTASVTVSIL